MLGSLAIAWRSDHAIDYPWKYRCGYWVFDGPWFRRMGGGSVMLWIAQSKEYGHIVAIFRSEDEIHELYDDNEHVNIYWVESDL